ncbi:MAG: hypothetical protein ACLFVI_00925 [Archaeoglobaceae archaeon]
MGLTFCEKNGMLKEMDHECWVCEFNVTSGGHCYPWRNIELKSEAGY